MEQIIQEILKHISILNDEVGGIQSIIGTLQIDVAVLKAQVSQVLWLQRAVLVVIIGFIISKVLTKAFNNKGDNKK